MPKICRIATSQTCQKKDAQILWNSVTSTCHGVYLMWFLLYLQPNTFNDLLKKYSTFAKRGNVKRFVFQLETIYFLFKY